MDNLIAEGSTKPFIIVMTYGMTNEIRRGGLQNFDIAPFIDTHFRTLSDQPNRAMAAKRLEGVRMDAAEETPQTLSRS